jgi:response regulator RpfG family c-di-GMP phosphodiesterase
MSEKILCVDDDHNILSAYQRQLRNKYYIDIALGGEAGLQHLQEKGPYAVIVSDLRMPGMDGVQFLTLAREAAPHTVRVMLTGQADMEDAINVVNEGNIFRFLTKPCPPDVLSKTLEDSIAQHHLLISEKELLEKTLSGSIQVLTDVLSLVNPEAFSRASRLKRYVQHIVSELKLSHVWQFEIAAMLSQIGFVTMPNELLEKVYAGKELSELEQKMYASHAAISKKLLCAIPRLESVSQMIEKQQMPFKSFSSEGTLNERDMESLGAQLLKVTIDFDNMINNGFTTSVALTKMERNEGEYDPKLLRALHTIDVGESKAEELQVFVDELNQEMVLAEHVRTKAGAQLALAGQEVTASLIERFRNFSNKGLIKEPISVFIPQSIQNSENDVEVQKEEVTQ